MRVLVLGSGAREHALCWKLSASSLLGALHCAPGNPGIERYARTHRAVSATDSSAVLALCRSESIDLVVVGPEAPLVEGVSDALRAAGMAVFGPSAGAAQIEGSKAFAKLVMHEAGVPTAITVTFSDHGAARRHAATAGSCVVKADGLAAGKGVIVCASSEEAVAAVECLAAGLGANAATILFEELLIGEEVSVIALCDGERYALLPFAQDHKRLLDGDRGPNTGGMGAYAPAMLGDPRLVDIGGSVIAPTLRAMAARGTPFIGALYAGLMLTEKGVRVLEYNARLGDPECQVLMMLIEDDLIPWLDGAARGRLPSGALRVRSGSAVGVVLAAEGYPESPRRGAPIDGIVAAEELGAHVFQAGTERQGPTLVTAGGRVLTVCAQSGSIAEARAKAYAALQQVSFPGAQFRTDIGARALEA